MAAAPYRAYILPARSCRPGKRSAARQWAQGMKGTARQSPTIGIPHLSRFNARRRCWTAPQKLDTQLSKVQFYG
ncbi:hypothetical protein MS5452_05400 [Klebsiella pneumoniae]|nr:hypothetical protein NUBL21984_42410 [Klebsiella pneumoniae]GKL93802.1 hypothetical protein NUBL21994_48660 [Klebsiella pneumoniae]GKN45287.1 hypothetical protein MS5452_05400 [Klebsiella pneumoniae]